MKLDLAKAIKNDFILAVSIILIVVFIGYGSWLQYNGEEMNLLYIILAGSILGVIGFIFRLNYINKLISTSFEVKGTITNKWFYRGRGKANFNYSIDGVEYSSSNSLMKNKVTDSLNKEDLITLLVDENNYTNSLIKHLYIK